MNLSVWVLDLCCHWAALKRYLCIICHSILAWILDLYRHHGSTLSLYFYPYSLFILGSFLHILSEKPPLSASPAHFYQLRSALFLSMPFVQHTKTTWHLVGDDHGSLTARCRIPFAQGAWFQLYMEELTQLINYIMLYGIFDLCMSCIDYYESTITCFCLLLVLYLAGQYFCPDKQVLMSSTLVGGGSHLFSHTDLIGYNKNPLPEPSLELKFKFVSYLPSQQALLDHGNGHNMAQIMCDLPLPLLLPNLTVADIKSIAIQHQVQIQSKWSKKQMSHEVYKHKCQGCSVFLTVLQVVDLDEVKSKRRLSNLAAVKKYQHSKMHPLDHELGPQAQVIPQGYLEGMPIESFPPDPPSLDLLCTIITDFCTDMSPLNFEEDGCAVCGSLVKMTKMKKLSDSKGDFDVLIRENVARNEICSPEDILVDFNKPVLIDGLSNVCLTCDAYLCKRKLPPLSLANGKWIGSIPLALSDLSFAEQMLVARIRHNRCIVHVSSGMHKMREPMLLPLQTLHQKFITYYPLTAQN